MPTGQRFRSELDLSKVDWSRVDATTDAEIAQWQSDWEKRELAKYAATGRAATGRGGRGTPEVGAYCGCFLSGGGSVGRLNVGAFFFG